MCVDEPSAMAMCGMDTAEIDIQVCERSQSHRSYNEMCLVPRWRSPAGLYVQKHPPLSIASLYLLYPITLSHTPCASPTPAHNHRFPPSRLLSHITLQWSGQPRLMESQRPAQLPPRGLPIRTDSVLILKSCRVLSDVSW